MSEYVCPARVEQIEALLKAPVRAALALIERLFATLPELSRYSIVSLMALGLDSSVFLALTHSSVTKASAAGVIGYCIGLLLHYTLSSRFVFDASKSTKSAARLFAEFAASGLVGLFLTWAVIGLVVEALGFWPLVGKGFAVVASFTVVYVIRRSVVFAASSAGAT